MASTVLPTAMHALFPRQSTGPSGSDGGSGGTSAGNEFLNLIGTPFDSQFLGDAAFASLITNIPLTVGIAILFCFLRPYNNVVYAPRAKHADSKHAPPPVEKGLFGWIPPLIRTKEQDLVDKVGLDAAVFMRFIRMLRNIMTVLTIVGCGVFIPINILGANTSKAKFGLQSLTPLYIFGSQIFWAYVVMAYVFDLIIFYFLWTNYRAVLRLRRAHFESKDYQQSLHSRTLLLTDIPKDLRSDDGILRIVEEFKATNDVPRAAIARNVKDLPELVEEHEETVRALEKVLAKYLKNPDKLPAKRPTCTVSKNDKSYRKGQKVDAIEYLTSRIKELEIEIKEVRESIDKRNAMSFGFASYEHIAAAHSAAYVGRKGGMDGTIVRLAPKPNDLIWKNLSILKKARGGQAFINNLWVALLTIVWVVPNILLAVFVSNLTNLGRVWPGFNDSLKAHQKAWAVVQGVASPAITTLFYYYLPAIFRRLCINAGDVTKTSRERHVMHKLYSFFVFNNLVVFSLFAAVWGFVSAVVHNSDGGENPWDAIVAQHPFQKVVQTLCTVSPYWISWLLQRNLGAAVDLSQLVRLLWGGFSRRFLAPTPRELIELSAPQPFDYAGYYNYFLFYSTVAICFAALQPLVLPVTALYFWLDSFLKKYMILYIFITKYESGGMFWRTLFNRVLTMTFLGNCVIALVVVAQGYQGSNWGMLAALAPLPFLILAFKIYCARTFDEPIHYFQKGKQMDDETYMAGTENKSRKRDRVGVRFGHPVLYKPLMTPMVAAKSHHLLKQIYSGRTSMEGNTAGGGYSDVYLDPMDSTKPGKPSDPTTSAPFEIVSDHQLDFEHWKNNPNFRDEAGGDGELYGHAQDLIRPGTPSTMLTRTGTSDTFASRSRSESRGSDTTRVAVGETEYPRGYHQTPSALREHSPAGSEFSSTDIGGGYRAGFGGVSALREQPSNEGLISGAARMGRSPPPPQERQQMPYNSTPGSTPGEENTSYDYFRRGRQP